VFMNLWATWCPPCRHEMPVLQRFYMEYRDRGVIVLGVDQGESPQVAGTYARAHSITYPILIDRDQRYGTAYIAIGLPTTIIVDRNGRIARGVDGEMTAAQMRAYIAPLLTRPRGRVSPDRRP
jgi:cytochrome c biogenesis protein CcmG/thiol:disulfide interchange protein DsbE